MEEAAAAAKNKTRYSSSESSRVESVDRSFGRSVGRTSNVVNSSPARSLLLSRLDSFLLLLLLLTAADALINDVAVVAVDSGLYYRRYTQHRRMM